MRERVEDILVILWGRWGRYPDDENEDMDEEERDPGRYKEKWRIGLSDEDVRPKQ